MDKRKGYDRLWRWFGLSYASWLTLPRVMMHEMPDDWQDRMATLLEEYDAYWDWNKVDRLDTRVQAVKSNGRLTQFPAWLLNYKHPDSVHIERLKSKEPTNG